MPRRLPPLTALRAFEAAARHASFVRAADELAVTPAAISHQVKALEAHLGVRLFRRRNRGLVLTDAGRGYLPALTEGLDRLARATERVTGGSVAGRLVISVLPSLALRWLGPRLGDLCRRYPDLDPEIRSETRSVDFRLDAVDVAIRYGLGHYPGLYTEPIMTEEVAPVCAPGLINAGRPLRRLADLAGHTLLHDCAVLPSEPSLGWPSWIAEAGLDAALAERGPRFSDSSLLLEAAADGLGIALGRSALTAADLAAGRLVRPLAQVRPAEFTYYLVCPEADADTPKVAALRNWLAEQRAAA